MSNDTEVKGMERKTIANTAENRRAALQKPPRRGAEQEDGEKIKEMKQDEVGGGEEKGEKEKRGKGLGGERTASFGAHSAISANTAFTAFSVVSAISSAFAAVA